MGHFLVTVLFVTFFGANTVFGLRCHCTNGQSVCNPDGTCTVDKGVCAILQMTGAGQSGIQQQCTQQNETNTGCSKTSANGFISLQCTCNDKDFCNMNFTQTDFGSRSSTTIKCKCSTGQTGCDSSGSCSTAGICIRVTQPGADVQQCSHQGGFIGCIKTKHSNGLESTSCGCENKDYCNGNNSATKQYIESLLFVLLTFWLFM